MKIIALGSAKNKLVSFKEYFPGDAGPTTFNATVAAMIAIIPIISTGRIFSFK